MKIAAILWDGFKQIEGQLHIGDTRLTFLFNDFAETDLLLDILYSEIRSVDLHQVFDLALIGVEIMTKNGKSNVFVVDEALKVKKAIEKKQTIFINQIKTKK